VLRVTACNRGHRGRTHGRMLANARATRSASAAVALGRLSALNTDVGAEAVRWAGGGYAV